MQKILVIGACGQIGSEVLETFRKKYGKGNVVGLDIRGPVGGDPGPHEIADALDKNALRSIIQKYGFDTVLNLAAVLSATGESDPDKAWRVNMDSLRNTLDLAREFRLRLFWPSSIAVFGANCPRNLTPQTPPLLPQTMYGITKVAGELLCDYYHRKYGVDVRSVRYPGLISYKTPPGGGTTDYAVEIYYAAIEKKEYTSFLREGTYLPMMFMEDGIRAIEELMDRDAADITVRTSYNLSAMSFSPEEVAAEIQKHIPEFRCFYRPDRRQQIAESWPKSIDDSEARKDWGWRPRYDLPAMTVEMLARLREKLGKS